jgi:hypothetical protein
MARSTAAWSQGGSTRYSTHSHGTNGSKRHSGQTYGGSGSLWSKDSGHTERISTRRPVTARGTSRRSSYGHTSSRSRDTGRGGFWSSLGGASSSTTSGASASLAYRNPLGIRVSVGWAPGKSSRATTRSHRHKHKSRRHHSRYRHHHSHRRNRGLGDKILGLFGSIFSGGKSRRHKDREYRSEATRPRVRMAVPEVAPRSMPRMAPGSLGTKYPSRQATYATVNPSRMAQEARRDGYNYGTGYSTSRPTSSRESHGKLPVSRRGQAVRRRRSEDEGGSWLTWWW